MKKPIILALSVLAGACGGGEPGAVPRSDTPVDVAVSQPVQTPEINAFPATVEAEEEVRLATRISGTILEFRTPVGTRVSAGDTLVVLDGQDIRARIAAARANLTLARRSHERIANLARDGAASQAELDQAEATLRAAEAGLEDVLAQAGYFLLTAPFAGTVTERFADPGDLAGPGQPLLTLTGEGDLKLVADLPSDLSSSVQVGRILPVSKPDGEGWVEARITRVVPALTPGSRRFRVEARFEEAPGPSVVPGTFVRLGIPKVGGATVQWVPADALVRRGQLTGLYTLEDDHLLLRWVRVGAIEGDAVEVLAGVDGGTRIVRRPTPDLFDGRSVGRVSPEPWSLGEGSGGVGSSAASSDLTSSTDEEVAS